ncbi:helix-turn-helix transcriptional regulator [Luteimicrobium subarcticum]|uniref:Sugar-specific transcriptional regulator TrmB n=1 Tax=Luteimicrobium subarcticum TaxID=620910 RepID=A0A2M8W1U3_9MICO|nr:LuxR family transcriptional regulator [Luteimicrobium subarcticum]PJI84894.1 sugar-specific transcriptional regulator TrmB [Luteimicrobium subarcticum]
MLEGVGLGEVEERVYRSLLKGPSPTERELADQLEASVVVARRAAQQLVTLGLATQQPGSPVRYAPVDPQLALTALVRARQAELERTTSAVSLYAAEFHERLLRTEPSRLVELVEGPTAITERLSHLILGAEHEVLAFNAPPYVVAGPGDQMSEEQTVLGRGVSVRAVYASEVLAVEGFAGVIRQDVARGERARVVPDVPLKMVVVDSRVAIIPLTDRAESARTTAVVVHRSRLCDALVELFEATWERGAPLFASAEGTAPEDGLEPVDREILELLGAGLKDESVGRQLGLSERTVRRRIAELVTRLGATSRFQAGAQAARRGWV